jgi:predicted transcriptional regulator
MAKNVQEYLDNLYEDEKKPTKKIEVEKVETQEEGALGNVVKTVANIGVPMVAGAYGGIGGAIAASSAMQLANQALAKRKAAKAAQAQAQQGAQNTDQKYAELAKQRAAAVG